MLVIMIPLKSKLIYFARHMYIYFSKLYKFTLS